ncbi:hypothetical protein RJ641_002417, partial [Dillenia turbinata]
MTSGVLPSQIAVDPVLATPHKSLALWRAPPHICLWRENTSPSPRSSDVPVFSFGTSLSGLVISVSMVSTTESPSDELEPFSSALIPSLSMCFSSSSSNMGGSCSGLTSTMCSLNIATESVLSASGSFTKRLSTEDSANLSSAVH